MKKFISILMAVVMVASLVVSASAYSAFNEDPTKDPLSTVDAIKAYEKETGTKVEVHTYYFQMPNGATGDKAASDITYNETDELTGETKPIAICKKGEQTPTWYNDYTKGAGIYWWGSAEVVPDGWVGYKATLVDAEQSLYSAVVPAKTNTIIWNNAVDGGTDKSQPIYYKAAQTVNIGCEAANPGELSSIPEGTDSFDGMIYVVDPNKVEVNDFSQKMTCGGNWYFYYGNGCYGSYATTSANFKGAIASCCNPDHAVLRGDYDGDGKLTIMDATRVQNIVAELATAPSKHLQLHYDATGDDSLTIMDATRIQNVLAELMNMDGKAL